MSKNHLLQNKEYAVTMSIIIGVVFLVLINIIVDVSTLLTISSRGTKNIKKDPIDIENVNQAIKLLNPK